ncbi:MAG: FixH family protein [Pirellulales bacterium]
MSIALSDQQKLAERRAKRFWVGAIVSLLSMQLIGGVVTVYLAVGDPTVAVIPNYYQAGLEWDVKHRNLDQFVHMQFQIELIVEPVDTQVDQRHVMLKLTKNGVPVGKQRVSASIYHHAKGTDVVKLTFDEGHEGEYVAPCRLTKSGLWEVDISVEGDHGIAETRFTMQVHDKVVSTQIDRGQPSHSDGGT